MDETAELLAGMMLEMLTVILTSIQILSAAAVSAAPTFAKFTAPPFSQESDTTRAGCRIWFLLAENSKLFLDVLTDKLGRNY